jgi:hypothetical protein
MNYEKANQWLKQNYPKLEGYEIRAMSDYLYYTACLPEEDYMECRERVRSSPAPIGFNYVIARRLAGGVFCGDVILLMPENL